MTVKNVAIRLGVEGQADVKRVYSDLGDAQDTAYARAQAGADRASAAVNKLTDDLKKATDAARAQASQAEGLAPSPVQQNIRSIVGIDTSGTKSARDSALALAAALAEQEKAEAAAQAKAKALRAEIDPLGAAQDVLAAKTTVADALLARGTITAAEHAAAVRLAKDAYADAEKAIGSASGAIGLNRSQFMELSHVARSAFDALSAGASPTRVIATEGGRLAQVMGEGNGGVAGSLKFLLGPVGLAIGGFGLLAVATGIGVKAALDYEAATSKAELALRYLGATSGASVQMVEAIAQAQAKGAGVSVSAATDMELSFAKTGKIGSDLFAGLISIQRDYAAATGQDSAKATEALGAAFADPAKGAAELTSQLHFLDGATLQHIKDLQAQGDLLGAQRVLFNNLQPAVAGARAQLTGLGEVVHGLSGFFQDAYRDAGKFFDRMVHEAPAAERIASLEQERAKAVAGAPSTYLPTRLGGAPRPVASRSVDAIDADLTAARKVAASQQTADDARAASAKIKDASVALDTAYDGLAPKEAQINDIRNKQVQLQKALGDPALLAAAGKSKGDIQRAIADGDKKIAQLEKDTTHVDRHALSLQRDAESMQANIAGQKALALAYLDSDASAVIAEAKRKAATDAAKKGADLDQRIAAQLQLSIAEQSASAAKHIAELRDQAGEQEGVNAAVDAGTLSLDDASRALKLQAALRPLLTLQAAAHRLGLTDEEAALQKLIDATKKYTAANDDALAHAAANQTHGAASEQITDLLLQIQYAGDLTGQLEQQLAVTQAIRAASKASQSPGDQLRAGADAGFLAVLKEEKTRADYAASTLRAQRDSAELNDAEVATIGLSVTAHDAIIAHLKAEQDLRSRNIDLASAEGVAILAGADDLQRQQAKMQALQASWNELKSTGDKIVDDVLSPSNWSNWSDAGKAAITDLLNEFVKLELANPLKNYLFSENLPTASGVGGVLSSLFGGGSVASSAASPVSTGLTFGSSGFLSGLTAGLPGFASGTDYAPGGMAWVAENGPELINLPRGSSVTPAPKTRAILAGNDNASMQVSVPVTINAPGADAAALARVEAQVRSLQQSLPTTILSTVADAKRRRIV